MQIEPESMAKHEVAPLLEVQLELVVPDIVWLPELSSDASARGVRDMLNTWLKSFLDIATLIKRLDTGEGESQLLPGTSHCDCRGTGVQPTSVCPSRAACPCAWCWQACHAQIVGTALC